MNREQKRKLHDRMRMIEQDKMWMSERRVSWGWMCVCMSIFIHTLSLCIPIIILSLSSSLSFSISLYVWHSKAHTHHHPSPPITTVPTRSTQRPAAYHPQCGWTVSWRKGHVGSRHAPAVCVRIVVYDVRCDEVWCVCVMMMIVVYDVRCDEVWCVCVMMMMMIVMYDVRCGKVWSAWWWWWRWCGW